MNTRATDLLEVVVQAQCIITEVQKAASREFERLREQFSIGRMGLSLYDTGKYRQITEDMFVAETGAGIWHVGVKGKHIDETDHENGRFALSYITQLLLVAQDSAPAAVAAIRIPIPLSEQPIWKERSQGGAKES